MKMLNGLQVIRTTSKSSVLSLTGYLPAAFMGAVLVFAMCGCTIQGLPMSKRVHPEAISQLWVGITTMADVRAVFGTPSGDYTIQERERQFKLIGSGEASQCSLYLSTSGNLVATFDKDEKLVDYDYITHADSKWFARKESDFSFTSATNIVVGNTTKSKVEKLLGSNYLVKTVNKPGVKERWKYAYDKTDKEYVSSGVAPGVPMFTMTGLHSGYLTSGGNVPVVETKDVIHERWITIDFDAAGMVIGLRGESNFPTDR